MPAYVGLGLLAEERGDARAALAYLQVAWETAPHRRDLRDHVVRLSQRLYGADGTLHLTRPALASLHCRAGRWSRAAAECAAVLAEHPTRIDVRLRLAEALWRAGDDAGAAAACRAVLAEAPLAVVALLILADIERRQGHTDEAARLLERARAVDPAGVRAADLIMVGMDEQAAFFAVDTIPVVEERPEPEPEPERPRIAPAPDFTAPLGQRPGRGLDAGGVFPTSAELEAARPSDTPQRGFTDMLRALEGDGLTPFRLEDVGLAAGEAPAAPAAAEEDLSALFSLPSDDEIEAARPSSDTPRGFTGTLRALEGAGLTPFGADLEGLEGFEDLGLPLLGEETPAQAEAEAEGTTASEWEALEAELEAAIPGETPRGFTAELESLEAEGLAPFQFGEEPAQPSPPSGPEPAAIEPFALDDLLSESPAPAAAGPSEEVEALADDALVDLDLGSLVEALGPRGSEAGTDQLQTVLLDGSRLVEPEREPESGPGQEPAESIGERDLTAVRVAMERVGLREELFARAREVKARLVTEGLLQGAVPVPGTEELAGPTLEELAAAVAERPDDAEARRTLAMALVEAGEGAAALEQYRWLYRQGDGLDGAALEGLERLAEQEGAAPAAHRLLGAIARARCEWRAAAAHYERSLAAYRRV